MEADKTYSTEKELPLETKISGDIALEVNVKLKELNDEAGAEHDFVYPHEEENILREIAFKTYDHDSVITSESSKEGYRARAKISAEILDNNRATIDCILGVARKIRGILKEQKVWSEADEPIVMGDVRAQSPEYMDNRLKNYYGKMH